MHAHVQATMASPIHRPDIFRWKTTKTKTPGSNKASKTRFIFAHSVLHIFIFVVVFPFLQYSARGINLNKCHTRVSFGHAHWLLIMNEWICDSAEEFSSNVQCKPAIEPV